MALYSDNERRPRKPDGLATSPQGEKKERLWQICEKCWKTEPKERLSISEVVAHLELIVWLRSQRSQRDWAGLLTIYAMKKQKPLTPTVNVARFRFEPRWPRVDPWPEPLWPEPTIRGPGRGSAIFWKAWPAPTRFDPNLEPIQSECQHSWRKVALIYCTCGGSSSRNPCLDSFWLVDFDYTSSMH